MKVFHIVIVCWTIGALEAYVSYNGHKVLSIIPKNASDLDLIHSLHRNYGIDLWNEPRILGIPVMTRLKPDLIKPVEELLSKYGLKYDVAFENLQDALDEERILHSKTNAENEKFDFGQYHKYEPIIDLLKELSSKYSDIATLESIGKSYENRPIYSMKITSGDSKDKPVIMMECGIHAREWSSVAAGIFIVNELITKYGSDDDITALVDKYEFNIVVESNPDGYIFTWEQDRLWRKTRSRSLLDWLGVCRGVDANRNFDVEHCGPGTSRKPCEEEFCGDRPFSESESRALRDMMIAKSDRIKAYFSLHAYSQLWMTPYGIKKALPSNYDELTRIGKAGVDALAKKYGTTFELGSIANIIYEAAGSSVDYAYEKQGIKIAFALELRDQGRHGFILPKKDILPMCEETFDGLKAAIQALKE